MSLDVLAVGAHPDDADLGTGGTLLKLTQAGYRTGILDLTRGELSSRGTPEERSAEAEAAAKLLGLAVRKNADLPDGQLANIPDQRKTLIALLCSLQPKVLLIPMPTDRHPDHRAAHNLVRDANYFAGVTRAAAPAKPHRADHAFYYHAYHQDAHQPLFVVDITAHFDTKLEALRAYQSQLHNPNYSGQDTYVSSAAFWDSIRIRAEYWGSRIGVTYGEPFYGEGPLALDLVPGLGVRT